MKKMWLLSTLLALPLVSAAGPLDFIGGIWNTILDIGGISFLQGFSLVAFTRILIWILVFALFFAVLSFLGAGGEAERKTFGFLKRNQAMVIAAVLATMTAIFLPVSAILAVGTGWATAVGLILIGAPIVGLGYVLWSFPTDKEGKSLPETKGTVLLKLLISLLLFWILSAMNFSLQAERGLNIGSASVAGTMANFIAWALYITTIMIIYYIVKFFLVGGNDEEAEKRWQEGGKALRKSIGEKMDAQKTREEMGRRAKEVREPHAYAVDAVEDCKKLVYALARGARPTERAEAVQKAEKHQNSLRKNLKNAVRSLRYLRRKERGEERARFYEIFDNLHTMAGVALKHAKDISIPKANVDDQHWAKSYNEIVKENINVITPLCGRIIETLNAFMENKNLEAAQQRTQEQARGQEPTEKQSNLHRRKEARLRAAVKAKKGR